MVLIETASAGEEVNLDMVGAGRGGDESGIVQYNDKLYAGDDTVMTLSSDMINPVRFHPRTG
jgi:hypothetical protein